MKAITTKWVGPTDTKGSRIIATETRESADDAGTRTDGSAIRLGCLS